MGFLRCASGIRAFTLGGANDLADWTAAAAKEVATKKKEGFFWRQLSVQAPCPTGEARITPGFQLPAKYIIHAVGPIWDGGNNGEAELLAGAYRSSLELADEQGCTSIAFPAISTGIFGYPLVQATQVAVNTVRQHLAGSTGIKRVFFACFSNDVLEAYRQAGVEAA